MAYCHCVDCRRWTGAPVAGFAAFATEDLIFEPPLGDAFSVNPGAERWSCPDCGSPLAARFDYLPDQMYIPLGVLDQAASLPPELHCHADAAMPWLHIVDDLERVRGSGRETLVAAKVE